VPETDEEHEDQTCDNGADSRGIGDFGQDDIDISGEPKGPEVWWRR
jgi:hypothetical protein